MIGIFDSGLGGMTVARALEEICPGYPYLYFGDLARSPYDFKNTEKIKDYILSNTEFLLSQGAKLIIIACNFAASTAGELLKQQFSIPVLDIIQPAVVRAIQVTHTGIIGVIGTRATINADTYTTKIHSIQPEARVYAQACPLFVPLIEEGWCNRRETKMVAKKYLHRLRSKQIDTLIFGCTHYPLLNSVITPRIGKKVTIVDPSIETARALKSFLEHDTARAQELYTPEEQNRFFVSDLPEHAAQLARSIFGRSVTLEKAYV